MRHEVFDDNMDVLEYFDQCVQGNTIYVRPGYYALSSKKLESLIKIAELQKYYQCNPVRFINDFFNIELLDAQAWIVQQSWTCPNVLLVCSRGFGKSTLIDLIVMAKDMLFNNYWTYIASGSGSQAEQTFTTLERLANDNIDSMLGSTGYIFKAEVEIKNAAGDGFSHSNNGFNYSLYNGSYTQTLNSNIDKKRGPFYPHISYAIWIFYYLNIRKGEKIMKNKYTDKELTFLKENYKTLTVKQMSEKIDRSAYSISAKLSELGLCKQPHKSWTNEECEFLKNNYMNMTNSEIAKTLDRPFNSISSQMDKLGLVRAKSWSKEDEDYLRDNFANMTHKQIGGVLNRTDSAVRAKCFDLGLYKKNEHWTEHELSFLRDNYREMSDRELSVILNRSENAIHLQASRMGMKKYPYFCNYHYFENIDTEEKAYWLGFLVADGWISKNEESNAGVVGIELQYGDINHLKKFNKSIGGNYRITDRWRSCLLSKYKDKKNHMCVIRIFSLTMLNSLLNLGFTNQKTFDYKIPHIKKDLLRHFIRGYFDGDGCFTFTSKSFNIGFLSASKDLRDDLYAILSNIGIYSSHHSETSEFDTPMYFINIYRQKDKIKFLDYIYKDCTIYLDRKYKKYLKVKEKYDTTKGLAA